MHAKQSDQVDFLQGLAEAKQADIVDVVAGYGVALKRQGRAWLARCPLHPDKTPSFRVDRARGRFRCFGCGQHGDVVDFVMAAERLTLKEAVAKLADPAGGAPAQRPRRREVDRAIEFARPEPDRKAALAAALALWRRTLPVTADTPAGRYLAARGCALPHPEGDLRWLPDHRHPCGWSGPALVALVTDGLTSEPLTLHQTWLDPTRLKEKAPVERPRLLWPGLPKAGGVVRLWPDEEVTLGLCIAEGLETALGAARGFGLAWATLDAGNMKLFPVLAGLDCLTIVADCDQPDQGGRRAGEAAAVACARRWFKAGVEIRIWLPNGEAIDFADIAQGLAA